MPDDIDYAQLNPGIRETVRMLRAHGFDTSDSGDGETHEHECDPEWSYVAIIVAPANLCEEADRLVVVLRKYGIEAQPMSMDEDDDAVIVEAMYNPLDGMALLYITNVHDDDLRPYAAN